MTVVCVYSGSSDKLTQNGAIYLEAARQMGVEIASRGWTLVYGAGRTGLMGAVARGALQSRGEVIGVIPEMFQTPQLLQTDLTRLEVVADMHTRKARMAALADCFVALPGGFGTLDELFEILTWAQIGLHTKAIGLLNTLGYFDSLLRFVEHAQREGFIYTEHASLFCRANTPAGLLNALSAYTPPENLKRWVTREKE
jgi:hypothetical protein